MVGVYIRQAITEPIGRLHQHLTAFGGQLLVVVAEDLAAVVDGGGIYTSSNYGTGWTKTSAPTSNWQSIASSSSGQYIAAVAGGEIGAIYTSSNYGSGWTKTSAPESKWQSIATSTNGQYLAAVIFGGGIYTSNNYGTDWVKTSANGSDWQSIASIAAVNILQL